MESGQSRRPADMRLMTAALEQLPRLAAAASTHAAALLRIVSASIACHC